MRKADPALCATVWWEGTQVADMTSEQKALVESLVASQKVIVGKSGRVLLARKVKE